MQINAQTLLASQQAAQIQAKPAATFAARLEKNEGFSSLPLKQTAPSAQDHPAAPVPANAFARPGSRIDIKV
jgi:hypothetical protein